MDKELMLTTIKLIKSQLKQLKNWIESEPEPQSPELKFEPVAPVEKKLIDGWWYIKNSKPVQSTDYEYEIYSSQARTATLSDLAVEIDGVKCWFVETDDMLRLYQIYKQSVTLRDNQLLDTKMVKYLSKLAELKHACIICKAQFDTLREEKK